VGLILPAALDIAPVLVPLAAVGLVVLMVGAIITHLRRHEARVIASPMARSPWPSWWRGAASAPSPSPADPARRLATPRPGRGSPWARPPRWR
jgi:DoxX-like family